MKFLKIGVSNEGGSMSTAPKNLEPSNYLNFITSCYAEKIKWSDPIEKDAVNLIVIWELALKHHNGIKVWDKTRKQHYRIHDKETAPLDSDIINVIKETYLDFRTYLEKEHEDIKLYNLDSDLISQILENLKEVCNSSLQL